MKGRLTLLIILTLLSLIICNAQTNKGSSSLKVAIFNLSPNHESSEFVEEMLDSLCKVFLEYDLMVIQGFNASKMNLLDAINRNHIVHYRTLLNNRYLYIYNTKKMKNIPKVEIADSSSLSINSFSVQTGLFHDFNNKIERDPFLAIFRTNDGSHLTFLNIHVKSKNSNTEIGESLKAMGQLYKKHEKHDAFKNIMLLGALSGDCEYVTPTYKYYLQMDYPLWHWALDGKYDTTVDGKNCTYDNAVVSADLVAKIKATGVDKRPVIESISDYYPVYFTIKLN